MKERLIKLLRWSEKYTKTDMVYFAETSFWINTNLVIVTILSFCLSILFARYVSKEVYGLYQFLISVASMLSALTLTGMNVAVGQAVSRGYEKVFKRSVSTQLKFSVIPFVVSICVALYYLYNGNATLFFGILAIGVMMPLTNTLNTWAAYCTGKKLFKPIFFYTQAINLLYFAPIIVAILFAPQTLTLVLFNFVFGFIANAFIYFDVLKRYQPNEQDDPEALKYGKCLSLSNILPTALFHIDNIVVFHFLGAVNLAIYSFASNIPDRFISLLRPVPTIAFPKFAEKDEKEVRKVLLSKLYKFFFLAAAAGVVYYFIAPFVYNFLFPQYKDSLLFSQVYVLVPILAIISSLSTTALFATRSNKIFISNMINPVFGIICVIVGGYSFGIWGVIGGKVMSNLFNLVSTTYFARRA